MRREPGTMIHHFYAIAGVGGDVLCHTIQPTAEEAMHAYVRAVANMGDRPVEDDVLHLMWEGMSERYGARCIPVTVTPRAAP